MRPTLIVYPRKIPSGVVQNRGAGHNGPEPTSNRIRARGQRQDLYDIEVIYDNAKRQLDETRGLTNDEQALLKALVAGIDRVRAGKSPDPFWDNDD